ncbi:P-loop containing nucleoside triphosphate hydrolase protein [Nemania sp. FL0031]|nr:P-loop containing nucleoside triphosphate hydrolase protein [Nemania sp. FL0031]
MSEQSDKDPSNPGNPTSEEVSEAAQTPESKDEEQIEEEKDVGKDDDGSGESESESDSDESETSSDGEEYNPEAIEDNSKARLEWIRQKREEGAKNAHLDKLMCQVGLEDMKSMFLSMKATVEAVHRRGGKVDLHLLLKQNEGIARRVGRGRESGSFKNMDSMRGAFAEACSRQANRLQQERLEWAKNDKKAEAPNMFFFTKEDLLGHPPPDMRQQSAAYKELQQLVGLKNVKNAVEELMDLARTNYFLEIRGKQLIQLNLNRVILGPPGTGKTTLAKLFGQILVDTKLVSKPEVVVRNADYFMTSCVGTSTRVTKQALIETRGKVLIIDDAHRLCPSSNWQRSESNSDKMLFEILDTLASEMSAKPGQDRCIILIGHAEQMRDLFYRSNPGLRSRFPLEDAIELRDYELPQLIEILNSKLKTDGISATEEAREVASQILARARHRPGFGNVYEVHNLVNRAWAAQKRRVPKQRIDLNETTNLNGITLSAEGDELDEQDVLTPEDFDPNWDRLSTAGSNWGEQFKDYVGFEKIVEKFKDLQETVVGMRLHGMDPRPHIPLTFVFKGPPGTGKTSTARKLGSLFYDMGFLAGEEVIECSATDLIGKYIGHTGPLVQSMLEKALGKVLFIDEAYRLGSKSRGASGSSFEEEAVGELVDSLTKPRFAQKIVIVLAGYSEDVDNLMRSNRGLRGRFATEIIFPSLTSDQCILLLERLIGRIGIMIQDRADVITEKNNNKVYSLLEKLRATQNWANARDIGTLANTAIGEVFREEGRRGRKSSGLQVSVDQLILLLQEMLESRVGGRLYLR